MIPLLGEDRDHVIALGRGHSLACMLLAVDLVLHKEMSLLFQVDVTVCAGVALRVSELVTQLHHHPPESQKSTIQPPLQDELGSLSFSIEIKWYKQCKLSIAEKKDNKSTDLRLLDQVLLFLTIIILQKV